MRRIVAAAILSAAMVGGLSACSHAPAICKGMTHAACEQNTRAASVVVASDPYLSGWDCALSENFDNTTCQERQAARDAETAKVLTPDPNTPEIVRRMLDNGDPGGCDCPHGGTHWFGG